MPEASPVAASPAPVAPVSPPPEAPPAAPVSRAERMAATLAAVEAKEAGEAAPEGAEAAPEAPVEEAAPAEPEPTAKDVRSKQLKLLQRERVLAAREKRLADIEARATQFQAATTDWRKDPARLLAAAGVDPLEFLNAQIQHALHNDPPAGPDPVALKVQEQLAPVLQQLEQERQRIAAVQETHEKAAVIHGAVKPLITPEKCECLLAYYGDDPNAAAAFVFQAVEEHWRESKGEVIPFAEAVEQLEEHFEARLRAGHERTSKMRKFAPPVAPPNPAPVVPRRAGRTLTSDNRPGMAPPVSRPTVSTGDKRQDRINRVLTKLG